MPDELKKKVFADLAGNVEEFLALAKDERQGALDDHKARLVEKYGEEYGEKAVGEALDAFVKKTVRESILKHDRRPDGRDSQDRSARSRARSASCRACTAPASSRAARRRC